MSPYPTRLERCGTDRLLIEWSDGARLEYTARGLREICPCATCREKRDQPPASPLALTVLSPAETQPLAVREMKPVGNYAYGILFSDGHDTGIFTFALLREIGQPPAASV